MRARPSGDSRGSEAWSSEASGSGGIGAPRDFAPGAAAVKRRRPVPSLDEIDPAALIGDEHRPVGGDGDISWVPAGDDGSNDAACRRIEHLHRTETVTAHPQSITGWCEGQPQARSAA